MTPSSTTLTDYAITVAAQTACGAAYNTLNMPFLTCIAILDIAS
jgi:hypothetical protein